MGKYNFKEIASGNFKPNRRVVISEAKQMDNGELSGYAISEQVVFDDNGKPLTMFMKNGLGVVSVQGLKILADTIDKALKTIENESACKCENQCDTCTPSYTCESDEIKENG